MKKSGSKFRRVLAVVVVLVTLLLLLFLFSATRSALDVWERLQGLPEPLFYTYITLILGVVLFSVWLIYRLLKPNQLNPDYNVEEISEENILKELDHADTVGMETSEMRREIEQLQARKETGRIYVALFGDVSTGKSSIVKALLPEATSSALDIDINVRGGSTQEIKQYTWKSTSGDELGLPTNLSTEDGSIQQVFVQSGGEEEVVKIYPDGREEKVVRERKADVFALAQALQDEIDKQSGALEALRDASVFVLVKQKLDVAKDDFRQDKAEEIIKSSTRKSGASTGQMKKSVPLILAVAGNGMKAFPGIGTVTGGLTHACGLWADI
ncbi:hypothetical protein GQR58_006855 [Nymphon striatum]|nr:hypothetical protein GQR58_006855 [Nymphon striatum]